MATPQLSPGVRIREVDLTVGRGDNVNPSIGGIAGPFEKGPVESPRRIEEEQNLLNVFGKPYNADNHFEYWMSASSYLSYGATLNVVRVDNTDLKNANAGVGIASTTTLKIKKFTTIIARTILQQITSSMLQRIWFMGKFSEGLSD